MRNHPHLDTVWHPPQWCWTGQRAGSWLYFIVEILPKCRCHFYEDKMEKFGPLRRQKGPQRKQGSLQHLNRCRKKGPAATRQQTSQSGKLGISSLRRRCHRHGCVYLARWQVVSPCGQSSHQRYWWDPDFSIGKDNIYSLTWILQ